MEPHDLTKLARLFRADGYALDRSGTGTVDRRLGRHNLGSCTTDTWVISGDVPDAMQVNYQISARE